MTEKPSFEEYAKMVAGVFKTTVPIVRTTEAKDVDGWDSISHAMFIMTIEETYGVTFSDDEIYTVPDVGAFYDLTLERMNG